MYCIPWVDPRTGSKIKSFCKTKIVLRYTEGTKYFLEINFRTFLHYFEKLLKHLLSSIDKIIESQTRNTDSNYNAFPLL